VGSIEKIRGIRAGLARGKVPANGELASLRSASIGFSAAFELPWPWDGEQFELREIRPLNYIIGPLGSGKTRLAMRLAETLPNAAKLSACEQNAWRCRGTLASSNGVCGLLARKIQRLPPDSLIPKDPRAISAESPIQLRCEDRCQHYDYKVNARDPAGRKGPLFMVRCSSPESRGVPRQRVAQSTPGNITKPCSSAIGVPRLHTTKGIIRMTRRSFR
jgi:hypothetical protein